MAKEKAREYNVIIMPIHDTQDLSSETDCQTVL